MTQNAVGVKFENKQNQWRSYRVPACAKWKNVIELPPTNCRVVQCKVVVKEREKQKQNNCRTEPSAAGAP